MSRNDLLFVLLCAAVVGTMASQRTAPARLAGPALSDGWVSREELAGLPETTNRCDASTASLSHPSCNEVRKPGPAPAKIVMGPLP